MTKKLRIFLFCFVGILSIFFITACSCKDETFKITLEQSEISVVEEVDLNKVAKDTVLTIKVTVPEGEEVESFKVDGAKKELAVILNTN